MSITDLMRQESERSNARFAKPMAGVVSSYDPTNHAVKVTFDTEVDDSGSPRISGWLPIRCQGGGAGASWAIGPTIGDQATVEHLEGDPENGIVTGFLHSTVDTPPSAQSSEAILRHTATGNYTKLNADGSFQTFHVSTGNYSKVDASGNLISHIKTPGSTFVYLGGDPAASPTPVFSPVSTAAGPSPFLKGRIS